MNLFPTPPTPQMAFYNQKLTDYLRAGILEATAQRLALKDVRAVFKKHSRPLGTQLRWHFQGDFSGQKYLFKEVRNDVSKA